MIAWASSVMAAVSLTAPAGAAELSINDGGTMWCQHYHSLGPFIEDFIRHGAIAYDEFPTCT